MQYVCTFKALWNESMIDSDFTPSVNLSIHTSKEMLVTEFYCLPNIIYNISTPSAGCNNVNNMKLSNCKSSCGMYSRNHV